MSKISSGKNKNKNSWIQSKAFYAVVTSLLIAIIGISTIIYNVAKLKNILPDSDTTEPLTVYTVPEAEEKPTQFEANANVTGIPDNRHEKETTEEKSTLNDLNRPYSGYFLLPLNSTVSKDYSSGEMVYSKTMNDWRTHDGIDVKGNIGDNVIAIQDGTVTDVYSDELWGEVIEIKHGNGLSARYCGVKATVRKNDHVDQGQVVGTLTEIPVEKESGIHVHLETFVNGKTADPVKALNLLGDHKQPDKNTQE